MDKVSKNLQTVTCTKAFINKVNLMVWDNTIGIQEVILKVPFLMGLEMAMDYGKEVLEIVINIKESIKTIKNRGMEFFLRQMVVCIKEIIKIF